MNYETFVTRCQQHMPPNDGEAADYLEYHSTRFFSTYELCASLVPRDGRLLSVGAGSAHVELTLARERAVQVTAVDFPDVITIYRNIYARHGFTAIGTDLSNAVLDLPVEACDMVLSAEIVEHIPAAPVRHFRQLTPYLKDGGHLVVTTPNLGSYRHIHALWHMAPIMDAPERTFGPVCFENQGVHRREYMPCEIVEAMTACGLEHAGTHFTWYHRQKDAKTRWLQQLVPRFRPVMTIVGRKV